MEGTKTCFKCLVEQSVREFYHHPSMADGRLNKCRTCTKADTDTWRNDPVNRQHWNAGRHRKRAKNQHGITDVEYDLLYEDPICAGCGKTDDEGRRLPIDHDHKTGAVRGLLCHQCNLVVGNAQDRPEILRNLADYLEGA
jgi:hypothetical protein